MSSGEKQLCIGLDFSTSPAFGREVLLAIKRVFFQVGGIQPITQTYLHRNAERLKELDGLIGYYDEWFLSELANLKIPVINVSARMAHCPVPVVTSDNLAIGSMAAEHFLHLGHQQFAFIGMDEHHYSTLRERGFRERLEAAKGSLSGCYQAIDVGRGAWLERHPPAVIEFLANLQEPTGLYCANDKIAERISHFAQELGIHTPEPLSLLGTDDDELSMLANGKGLSSIKPDYPGIGRTAARLMLKLLKGQPAPAGPILLPPLELVARESSDFAANVDPRMGKVIRFIQNNACGRIRIEDVLKQVPMSRRHFEIQFKQTFGCSPYEEIIHIRIQAARNLLRHSPELTVAEVADRCGYDNSKQFSVAFRKVMGLTPSQFREQNRADAVSAP